MVNTTCPVIPDKPSDPKPFFDNGNIDFKAHDVGWLVCGFMALVATISSAWLIWKHLTYYTCPQQQRHIVRLLIMVPIYAVVSFMSYLFYEEALYYQTIRDCYEAVLVTSFFYLILAYTGDTRAEQHAVFRNLELQDRFWVWPLGSWKYKPEGLHFLWIMKICVLQYAIIRPLCTFVAVGTEYFGYYCLHSWMPWFTHVWCAFFISVSVTVAVYCLIQLYMPVRKFVDPYKPILKFLSIKTIVFLTFWQDVMLSFLVSFGAIKETEYFTAEQIQAGINALLQCFWMMLFGFIHIKAFSYLPYRPEDRSRTTRRGRALLDSLDFRDWFFEMKESTRYIAARSKGRDYTLAEDLRAKRHQHLLNALGKERTANLETEIDMEKAALPTFWKHKEHAKDWTPSGTNTDSAFGSNKHAPSNPADAYTSLPLSSSRPTMRQASYSQTAASRDSQTQRAAELQRLVAELDLQAVDQSIVGAEDHDYGYEDDRYERAGLMYQHKDVKGIKDLESPCKDEFPELTQYHTPTIQLANVPSLTYDQVTLSDAKQKQDDSAVAKEEDSHVPSAPKTAPSGGLASWFGWTGAVSADERHQQHQQQISNETPGAGAGDYLRPGQAYGADAAPRSPDGEGTGWWRNYWDRVSYLGSAEPSVVGAEEEDEKDKFDAAPPAVLREVRAGSWGTRTPPTGQQQAQQDLQRSRAIPPELRIKTDSPPNGHKGGDMSIDSTNSFSPHDHSPLTRFIQTSRDSFSSLNRDEIREQLAAASSSPSKPVQTSSSKLNPKNSDARQTATETAPLSVKKRRSGSETSIARRSMEAPARPPRTPRTSSLAASARRASAGNPVLSTTRPDLTSASNTTSSSAFNAARQSTTGTRSTAARAKNPIIFADALVTSPVAKEVPAITVEAVPTKTLPPAVGPKGKLFNLVLPSPLSPARFPYGQEGDAPQPAPVDTLTADQGATSRDAQTSQQPKQINTGGNGTLKWASQSKPAKHAADAFSASTTASIPQGKNIITVGGMSLAQAKAAQEAQEREQAAAQVEARQQPVNTSAPKSILKDGGTVKEGKLVLPAPSKLASIGMRDDDPYLAGQSATGSSIRSPPRSEKRRASGPPASTAASSAQTSTTFEVGNIVPREAVVRASLPANVPLRGYYNSLGRSSAFAPFQMDDGSMRGSYVGQRRGPPTSLSIMSGPRPAMLPPHPNQIYGPPQPQEPRQSQMFAPQAQTRPPSSFVQQQQQQYRPPPPLHYREQMQQQRPQPYQQYAEPPYSRPPPMPHPVQMQPAHPHQLRTYPQHPRDPRDVRQYPHHQQYPQQPQYPQRPQQPPAGPPSQRESRFGNDYYRF